MLNITGADTGLNIYGSDAATDKLITRSNIVVDSLNPVLYGISLSISNSATIPFSFRNISYALDMSQATSTEWLPGMNYPFLFYGISIAQTVHNSSIVGIDMQMDNAVLEMSNDSSDGTFLYGMWANPYYSSIQAVFNSCTFNLSDFSSRGGTLAGIMQFRQAQSTTIAFLTCIPVPKALSVCTSVLIMILVLAFPS